MSQAVMGGGAWSQRREARSQGTTSTSASRCPIIWFWTRMWQRGAFGRLWFLSQICESWSTGPRGLPRHGFSENLCVLWRV